HDQFMDQFDDSVSLQSVYEKVRPKLACLREAAPLLELDQDQQSIEDEGSVVLQNRPSVQPAVRLPPTPTTYVPSPLAPYPPYQLLHNEFAMQELRTTSSTEPPMTPLLSSPADSFGDDILQTKLSDLTVEGVISLIERIEDLKPALTKLAPILRENSISGRVLKYCELNDLKQVLNLSFGHWELFRLLITTMRDCEKVQRKFKPMPAIADVPANPVVTATKDQIDTHTLAPRESHSRKNSTTLHMEKQVTLEEQMICGALQTLNEDAFE
ncbi:hypothetical protein DOY81_014734, partial [Sarcophaga bullata]